MVKVPFKFRTFLCLIFASINKPGPSLNASVANCIHCIQQLSINSRRQRLKMSISLQAQESLRFGEKFGVPQGFVGKPLTTFNFDHHTPTFKLMGDQSTHKFTAAREPLATFNFDHHTPTFQLMGDQSTHKFTAAAHPGTSTGSYNPVSPKTQKTKFRFTLDETSAGKLSSRQREFYEENGFLVIPNLVSTELIDECRQRFLDLVEGKVDRGSILMMKDLSLKDRSGLPAERIYNKIQDYVWDEVLSKYICLPELLDYVQCFTGKDIRAVHSMLINKPPDAGTKTSRHPLHQDLHYFPFRPADRIVAAWTAMEHIDDKNGCLVVHPGSHKAELLQHDYPEWEGGVNKMYHGIRGLEDKPRVHLHMEKGDTVFFHPLLVHGSGTNVSNNFRKAMCCHYATGNLDYIDVTGTSQENIAKEVEDIASRRGVSVDFVDLWKFRSRDVRGKRAHL